MLIWVYVKLGIFWFVKGLEVKKKMCSMVGFLVI